MTDPQTGQKTANYICHVFEASGLTVTAGVNMGDPVGDLDELCLGDVYEFSEDIPALRLLVKDDVQSDGAAGHFLAQSAGHAKVAQGSDIGRDDANILLTASLTFMAPDGDKTKILLINIDPDTPDKTQVFLPISPIEPGLDYTLIHIQKDPKDVLLSDITSVAFIRGTLITLADGRQRAVEEIQPGELVLTRGAGPQPVRHVIQRTLRAVGAFAPVVIEKGCLGNANDLIVSQHQRLFIYQRGTDRIVETSEMLARAGDLVNGDSITLRKGGFADYVSLVFDQHEVIYAECIPAESLLVNDVTRAHLPKDAQTMLGDLSQAQTHATEASSKDLARTKERLLKNHKQ